MEWSNEEREKLSNREMSINMERWRRPCERGGRGCNLVYWLPGETWLAETAEKTKGEKTEESYKMGITLYVN